MEYRCLYVEIRGWLFFSSESDDLSSSRSYLLKSGSVFVSGLSRSHDEYRVDILSNEGK